MATATRWRGGARWHLPARRIGAPAFVVVLGAAAIVRARYGIDFGDSSHAVALAMRMAQGDEPFRDEMNLQVLGSWPAVPFVWAWLHVVGLDGIVLASRVWFVVLTALCGYVAWRAVAPLFGRATAAAALGIALVPAAYDQQVVSYNTTPALMYVVSACAATAASAARSPRSWLWGGVAGAAATLGALSHPVTTPAALALLAVTLVRSGGRARIAVLAGSGSVAVGIVAVAWLVWGLSSISDTLTFTADYQANRPARTARLGTWMDYYGSAMTSPWMVSALTLGALAAVPRLRRTRTPLLVGAVAVAGIHALAQAASSATYAVESWYSGVLGTVLVAVLLPAALVCAVRRRSPLLTLVATGLPASLVGMLAVAAFTSSSPVWGASAAVLAPGLLAAVLAALVWLEHDGRAAKAALAVTLFAALGTSHALNSYRDAPLRDLTATVGGGAFGGLVTTPQRSALVEQDERAVGRCAAPGEGVLAYLFPTAFLLGDVRFDTPIIWTVAGSASDKVVRWVDDTGRVPACVVASPTYLPRFGDRGTAQPDPLRDWIMANYRPVSQTAHLVVLRRHT